MPIQALSVNQLKTWSTCAVKFQLDVVQKLHWPSDPKNFRLGKGVHQLLDYASRDLPLDPIIDDADADIVASYNAITDSDWATFPILASEWGFSLGFGSTWLYGRMDRIIRWSYEGRDCIAILDWKTGTAIPKQVETDWQTQVYCYALVEAQREFGLSISPSDVVMVYVQANPDRMRHVVVEHSLEKHQAIYDRLIASFQAIDEAQQQQNYPLPSACPDKHCPYRSICGIDAVETAQLLTAGGSECS